MEHEILALPMECWRWIPGYEGLYQVSTRGRVRSVGMWVIYKDGSKHFWESRILKQHRNKKTGYLQVILSRDGKQRLFLVHRLVAMAWVSNPEGKPEVNHLNEQKDMNFVENLSWATRKENNNWGSRNKRMAASQLNNSRSIPVQAIDPSTGEVVREFPSMHEAERKGFGRNAISRCCLGKYGFKTHHGFEWRFKP